MWLTLPRHEYAGRRLWQRNVSWSWPNSYGPYWFPFRFYSWHKNRTRKKILWWLLGLGAAVSFYYLYGLIVYRAHAEISYMHINYKSNFQGTISKIPTAFYLIATLAPVFVSSVKRAYMLGIIIGLSALVSIIFFTECLISIWCFFGAVVSFIVYYTIRESHSKIPQRDPYFHLGRR